MNAKPRCINVLIVITLVLSALLTGPSVKKVEAASPSVVISQVYGGGGGSSSKYKNDFIELFNKTNNAIDISGWSLQYASVSGTTWYPQVFPAGTIIPANSYFLIQQASSGTGGTDYLPAPDIIPTPESIFSMNSTTAKVALVNSTIALSGANPAGTSTVIDLVGYGTATGYEGTGPIPGANDTTSIKRKNSCVDSDSNLSDFTTSTPPTPRNSTNTQICNAPIIPTCPMRLVTDAGVAKNASFSAVDADSIVTSAEITGGSASGISISYTAATEINGALTGTLSVANNVAINTYDVVISFTNDDTVPETQTCTVPVSVYDPSLGIQVTGPEDITTAIFTEASSNFMATDSDSAVNSVSITSAPVTGITLTDIVPAAADGGILTGTLTVADSVPSGGYSVELSFTNDDGQETKKTVSVTVSNQEINAPTCPTSIEISEGQNATRSISASDPDGRVISAAITGDAVAGISIENSNAAASIGGSYTAELTIADSTAGSITPYSVVITFTNDDPGTPQTKTCTVPVTVVPTTCPVGAFTNYSIHDIQGSGDVSPVVNTSVSFTGIITALNYSTTAKNQIVGFYIQSADADVDADPLTSEGVYVYTGTKNAADYGIGSQVLVNGYVKEYYDLTEITNNSSPAVSLTVSKCGSQGNPLPSVTPITLPLGDGETLERYEGMLVHVNGPLVIGQNYFLARYGQLTLSAGRRMFNATNGNGLGDTAAANAAITIFLDDSVNAQNPGPVPFYDVVRPNRAGDVIADGITGIMDWGTINASSTYGYRIEKVIDPIITSANPRTAAPENVGGEIKLAGFNVENFFTTILKNTPYPSSCAYESSNTPRGAEVVSGYAANAEYLRQLDKTVAALVGLDADIVGLVEIESCTEAQATQALVAALNAKLPTDKQYEIIDTPLPTADISGLSAPVNAYSADYIKVDIIYRPTKVTPVNSPKSYTEKLTAYGYDETFDRFPIAQVFETVATGEKFSVIANHFKSKGCTDATGEDLDTGQGCWNAKRVAQAKALLDFVELIQEYAQDPDVILVGDYNAYGAEDPINTLTGAGMINEMLRVPAATRYTYVYDGMAGYIDQMIATSSFDSQITGIAPWHINSDEATMLDYTLSYKPAAQLALFSVDPYRTSDHDPILIGISPNTGPSASTIIIDTQPAYPGKTFFMELPDGLFLDPTLNEVLTYSATLANGDPLPAWLTFNPENRTLLGTPPQSNEGQSLSIKISVTDHAGATASQTFTLNIYYAINLPLVFK